VAPVSYPATRGNRWVTLKALQQNRTKAMEDKQKIDERQWILRLVVPENENFPGNFFLSSLVKRWVTDWRRDTEGLPNA
jgi:hypothetical protein